MMRKLRKYIVAGERRESFAEMLLRTSLSTVGEHDSWYCRNQPSRTQADLGAPITHHTQAMVDHLRDTRPWVLFLSILGFLGGGIMVVFALIMSLLPLFSDTGWESVSFAIVGVLFYGGFGAFYLLFAFLLLRYARSISSVLVANNVEDVEGAIEAQRFLFKASGIATIIIFGLMMLTFILTILLAIATTSH